MGDKNVWEHFLNCKNDALTVEDGKRWSMGVVQENKCERRSMITWVGESVKKNRKIAQNDTMLAVFGGDARRKRSADAWLAPGSLYWKQLTREGGDLDSRRTSG